LAGGRAGGDGEASGDADARPPAPNTPPYQIALTVCVDCCLCSLHHVLLHAGAIVVRGVPGDLHVTHADGRAYGAAPRASALTHVGQAPLRIRAPAAPASPVSSRGRNRLVQDP